MKRFPVWITVLSAIALLSSAWAGEGKKAAPQQLRLELDLADGSRVIGIPSIEAVPVQTSYAKMDVPLKEILAIKIAEDHENATLDLRNGDKLKGVVSLKPITLETLFGKVSVGIEHIRTISVVLSGGALPDPLRQGLVLYYSFDRDEGGKVTDQSGRKNNGEVHGAKWTPKGKVGGACDFDGKSDFIELGPTSLYKTTGHLSACAWVQPRGQVAILLSNYHGGGAYNGQFFFAYSGTPGANPNAGQGLDLLFGQPPYASAGYIRYHTRGIEMSNGEWHHVAFSYDETRGKGQKIKFFADGAEAPVGLIESEGNGGPILDIGENLRIMAHRDTPTGTLSDGLVDEVMIFDRALTGEEVKQIYDAQK